jgi:hypothetical protein
MESIKDHGKSWKIEEYNSFDLIKWKYIKAEELIFL